MSSGTTFAPPRWAKLIGHPRGVGGFGVASPFAVCRPTAALTSVPANTQNEEPAPSRIWKRLSATMGESTSQMCSLARSCEPSRPRFAAERVARLLWRLPARALA